MDHFQPQIKELYSELSSKYPGLIAIKEGSISSDTKTDLVAKFQENGTTRYIKAYARTDLGNEIGTKEIDMIELFNKFAQETGSTFSGPIVLRREDNPLHIVMEDVSEGKTLVEFPKKQAKELITLYQEYRKEFDEFEKYSNGASSKVHDKDKYSDYDSAIAKKKEHLKKRVDSGKDHVSTLVDLDVEKIQKLFSVLVGMVQEYQLEYTFGRFWTGHVYSDGHKHQLLDLENIGYQVKGTELLGIIRSHNLLAVHKYKSYEEWKSEFENWYQVLSANIGDQELLDAQLFMKLVGTVYMDFGRLLIMPHREAEIIEESGSSAEEYTTRGIQRNSRLLKELYGL